MLKDIVSAFDIQDVGALFALFYTMAYNDGCCRREVGLYCF